MSVCLFAPKEHCACDDDKNCPYKAVSPTPEVNTNALREREIAAFKAFIERENEAWPGTMSLACRAWLARAALPTEPTAAPEGSALTDERALAIHDEVALKLEKVPFDDWNAMCIAVVQETVRAAVAGGDRTASSQAGDLVPDPVVRQALNAYEQIGSHYEGIKAVVALVRGQTDTFVDQIDAEQVARDWIKALVPNNREQAFWQYESLSFSPQDGRVHILRAHDRVVAVAVIVRDGFNRSNLLRWQPASAPVRQDACDHEWVSSLRPDIVQGEWCNKCQMVRNHEEASAPAAKRTYTMGDWSADLDNPHGGR